MRWYERPAAAEATPAVWNRFRAERKTTSRKTFAEWRTAKISSFVVAARAKVKKARPAAWFTVAVLGKYPSCVESVGQDWKEWLNAGQVDYIVPMNYSADLAKYKSFVTVQSQARVHARRTISGIGVTANGLNLTAWQINRQVAAARAAGLAGVAFFDLDETLVRLSSISTRRSCASCRQSDGERFLRGPQSSDLRCWEIGRLGDSEEIIKGIQAS